MIFHQYTVPLTYKQACEILDRGLLEGEDQQKLVDELHKHKQEIIDITEQQQRSKGL